MFLQIDDLLNPAEIDRLRALAATARFVDGKISNPASTVKNNLQADHADPAYAESSNLVLQALARNPDFKSYAAPKSIAPPLLARYMPGMAYGLHTDVAFMAVNRRPFRADLSCTVFLNDPASYDGGELSILLGTREVDFRLRPGGAIVYPSTTLHQVKPVTRGERLVSITFVESQIADPYQRELLHELNEVLAFDGTRLSDEGLAHLEHVRHGLHRMWGQSG